MDKKKTILVLLAFSLALSLYLVANYGKKKIDDQAKPTAVVSKRVEVETVKWGKEAHLSELSAVLHPSEEASLSFEINGRIVAMSAKEGDQVNAGDVLARLDGSEYSLEVSQDVTDVVNTEVDYRQAKEDFNRMEKLYSIDGISRNEFEKAQNSFIIAEKKYLQAQRAHSIATDKNLLKSPINGTVIAKFASTGQLVMDGEPMVYRIGQVNPLKVLLPVPDRDISVWRVGDTVTLSLYKDTREGKVTRIFPATNQGTGTISVEVIVNNPQRNWYPGQVVTASHFAPAKQSLFVSMEAVLNSGEEKPYVFLVSGDKAVKTAVTVGELLDNRLEILSGLREGEQVVVKGATGLFDGELIQLAGGLQND